MTANANVDAIYQASPNTSGSKSVSSVLKSANEINKTSAVVINPKETITIIYSIADQDAEQFHQDPSREQIAPRSTPTTAW